MTWHIVERCKRTKLVDEIVVAVPFNADNHELADHIYREFGPEHLATVPGDESDLIGRYFITAKALKADFIIRVSGDNPCVEPREIDILVSWPHSLESPCRRLVLNSESFLGDHDGFGGELYPLEMLEWMDKTLKNPIYREHPHKFWQDVNSYHYCGDYYNHGFRLDVNTQVDYEKIKDIYEALYPTNPEFTIKDVMEYLNGKTVDART